MSNKQPDSRRTRLATEAYLAAFTACVGWRPNTMIDQRAQSYAQQTLGAPAVWERSLVLAAYRRGWHDKARRKPCQPWPDGESEGQG